MLRTHIPKWSETRNSCNVKPSFERNFSATPDEDDDIRALVLRLGFCGIVTWLKVDYNDYK